MSGANPNNKKKFHGFSFMGESVTFSLTDAVDTIEFDTGKTLSEQQVNAVDMYLQISRDHVNEIADRILEWRKMKGIKDIFLAKFEVELPGDKVVTFTMKQYLAATQASLPNYPFDIALVRNTYKSLLENNEHRRLVYDAIKSHLNRHN